MHFILIIFAILMVFTSATNPDKGFYSVIILTIFLIFGLIQFPYLFIAVIVGTVIWIIYYVLKNHL